MLERRRSVRLLTLAFYVLHVIGHVNPTSTLHVKYQQQKAKSERAAGKLFQRSQQTCTSLDKSVHPDHPHLRHPRAAPGGDKFGKALYFSGNEVLKLKGPNSVNDYSTIPREAFTVEAWVKPEGGQDNPAVIMGVFDVCSMSSRDKGWSLGINSSEEDGERDARFYFRLRTDRARQASTIVAHYRYEPNKWLHLAASYNGHRMALYINSAKVGVSLEQKGSLFSRTSSKCKELEIGGDLAIRNFFRGNFDNFLLWSDSVPHRQIKNNMHNPTIPKGTKNLLMQDDFSNHDMWVTTNDKNVEVVLSDVPLQPLDLRLTAPPCGLTVCDNPEVVHSHAENWQLRVPKEVRYRVINVAEDDGRNPTVSREQIQYQHKKLNEAFQSYNISWSLTEVNIYNTSLRRTTIISDCEPSMVGNGVCNPDCKHEVTGNDGGDCDELEQQCQVEMVGDGTCDTSCNRVYHHWDGGDCCNPDTTETYRTCFDPSSPNKAYMSLREYKAILDFNSTTHLNLYFAAWTQEARLGIATFPWEKEVHGVYGGTVLQPENFGRPNVTDLMIHELGHNLGLWHVHHGVDEMDCSNECLETRPSMELGDLCADTHPTPMNNECKDPDYDQSKCGLAPFKHTPYNNFMSYADDSCTESFTPQQTARMHCYLDLAYHGWQVQKTLPAIVLPPKVLVVTSKTLSIGWLPPLTGELFGMSRDCGRCTRHKTLVQYGSTAYSPNPSKPKGYWGWTTSEATGPPDAESCIPSGKGWLPDVTMCNPCYIELGLDIPVVPARLSVWVNWNAANGINNILLIYIDGTDTSLGSVNAYCDMPFTTKIKAYKKLKKIRIYTSSPYVSIDAVQVESSTAHPICEHCKKIKYKVRREPPFAIGEETAVDTTSFLDSDVQAGVMYKYWVSAAVGSVTSMPSPVLEYSFPDAFCGDGAIQGSEECDDANAIYGDGCDLDCQLEEFFHCEGEPSLCYLHDGDGVCEDFERRSSIQDCGFYTPQGFTDQWASEAMANPKYQNNACPENVIIGPPLRTQMCRPEVDPLTAWQPCSFSDGIDLYPLYWLRVTFPRPVVAVAVIIYLASDGITERSDEQKTVSVSLIDTEGREHDIASRQVPLSCKHNPVEVPVVHDLTAPFYHTKATKIKFISSNIAISAIALRSSNTLDPVAISRCQHGELYNPASQQCHAAMTCKKTTCPPLMVKYASVNSRTLKRDSLSNCSGMQDGDSCSVQCNRGYLPMGPRYVMCIKGRWNTEDLSCKPMDCREPNIPHASIVCKEGHSFGKKCTFKCKPPAKLQGDDNTIRCEEDGLWSLPQAFCQLICGPPPKQENANLATRRCLDSTNHHVGTSCKFRCKRGYHVVGTSSHSMPPYDRRVFRRSCSEEGLWEGPTCERVKCKSPPPMFKGLYNCTMGFDYQSKCTLRCGENDKMGTTITCQRDGNWDGAFKMCKNLKGDCPKIQSKDDVAFQCRGSSIGATCKAVCTSGGNIPIITRANDKMFQTPRSEDRRGPTSPHSWSYKSLANKFEKMAKSKMTMTTVKDVLLTCTGGLAWYPDPLDVGCVKECSEDFIDDGWCDQQNNRAFCNYDGGDCCESTNGNGKVQPFPANCKEECRCKDPNAIENRNGKGKDKSKGVLDPIWDRETNYSQEVSAEKLNEYSYNDKADDGFDYI